MFNAEFEVEFKREMLNSQFLFNRILENVGIDTLHNGLLKNYSDFIILLKPHDSSYEEIYNIETVVMQSSTPLMTTTAQQITTTRKSISPVTTTLGIFSFNS